MKWNTELADITGSRDAALGQRAPCSATPSTARPRTCAVDGIFIAIGHTPQTSIFAGKLDMKPGGYLQVKPGTTQTNIPGVYAAGDVTDDVFRQAVTAAGMGCMAALEAERFLAAEHLAEAAE